MPASQRRASIGVGSGAAPKSGKRSSRFPTAIRVLVLGGYDVQILAMSYGSVGWVRWPVGALVSASTKTITAAHRAFGTEVEMQFGGRADTVPIRRLSGAENCDKTRGGMNSRNTDDSVANSTVSFRPAVCEADPRGPRCQLAAALRNASPVRRPDAQTSNDTRAAPGDGTRSAAGGSYRGSR